MKYHLIGCLPALLTTSLLPVSLHAAGIPTNRLVLHLDASSVSPDSGGGDVRVPLWQDLSGLGNHVAQEDVSKQPRLAADALNGLPVVRFAGAAYLDGSAVLEEGDKSFTIAAVWRRGPSRGAQVICEQASAGTGRRASLLTLDGGYGFNGQNNDQHRLTTYTSAAFTISILTLDDNGDVALWHNDNSAARAVGGKIDGSRQNTGDDKFRIGAKITSDQEYLSGDIAEILIYERVLEFEEVTALNEHLGEKWDLAKEGDGDRRRARTMPRELSASADEREPRDRTSRVPKYTFADTLEEQEAQLKANPMLQQFAESRKLMADDPHRPVYHYVNPLGSLNDPNGLCFWQGRWHLFYQAYPPEDTRQHWGHAVSDDLIHWRDLPLAIYPNPEDKCFSGATLVEEDRVIAMYHGTSAGNMVAVSSDPLLLNWEKVTGQPVIPMTNPDGSPLPYRVFDPCIWKKGDMYYSLSGGTLPDGPDGKHIRANFLLRSEDLAKWEYLHPFAENDHYSLVGDDGACPYFWPIGDKHILLHYSHMSGGKYLLGDYDTERDKFAVTMGGDFNFGPSGPAGVHAPSATPDGEGGVIVIFNMNPGKPTQGWNQIMTLPRRLTLIVEDQLGIEPAGDIESLRREHQHVDTMTLPANQEVVLESISGSAMEIIAEIDPKGAPMVELNVLRSPNREELTRIAFYKDRGYRHREYGREHPYSNKHSSLITIDSSYSSILPEARSRAPETAPVFIDRDEPLTLRVFVDKSVVEVFVNGKQCVALRVYPGRDDSLGVSLRSQGRDAELKSLDAWQMENIYE
jgi:beta-fructofuranosidase